jgi:hypothetical protein
MTAYSVESASVLQSGCGWRKQYSVGFSASISLTTKPLRSAEASICIEPATVGLTQLHRWCGDFRRVSHRTDQQTVIDWIIGHAPAGERDLIQVVEL